MAAGCDPVWDDVPRYAMREYTEGDCSAEVALLLKLACDDLYSHENGAMWDRAGNARKGGTRATPGFPDRTFYVNDPFAYTLTVECKGYGTRVDAQQWAYAMFRMQRGDVHFIVRSAEALMNGLRYMGLMPLSWARNPPRRPDPRMLPENFAFMERMRMRYWQRVTGNAPHGFEMRVPQYAQHYQPQWLSQRALVLPSHVPALLAEDQLRKAGVRAARKGR